MRSLGGKLCWAVAVGAVGAMSSAASAGFIMPNDSASMSLVVTNANQESFFASWGGEAPVQRGAEWRSLGGSIFGGLGQIMARWDEFEDEGGDWVRAEWKQSAGTDLFPGEALVQGQPAIFWRWQMGLSDRVTFDNGHGTISVVEAVVRLSRDGGATFFNTSTFTNTFQGPWNGSDAGVRQSTVGARVNLIQVNYRLTQVPAPGTLGGMGVAAVLMARRTRRF